MDVRVTLRDLASVRRETFEASSKWYDVGLELGVPVDELDRIQCDHGLESNVCHREMLKCWLKESDSTSWTTLIEALRSVVVGENSLAQKLEDKHCPSAIKSEHSVLKEDEGDSLSHSIRQLVIERGCNTNIVF